MPRKRRSPRLLGSKEETDLLDEVNLRLLGELEADPRCATAELARRVGMSAPAVRERVLRLEQAGVIAGYRTEVDPASLGYPVTAFTRIRPMPGALPKIAQLAAEIPEVTECYRITGEDCFLVKVHAPALGRLEEVLDRFLGYGNTTTSIVVSTPVPARHLPLPAAPGRPEPPGRIRPPAAPRSLPSHIVHP
jgi:Lrp/AsnC family transcriptional regulator, leucine-responsive regulatory protein